MRLRFRTPAPGTVLGGLALIVAMSGVAIGAIPSSTEGTITACAEARDGVFDNKKGTLRVIDAENGAVCEPSKEVTLRWRDGITGKVADADKLDGKDSADFANRARVEALERNFAPTLTLNVAVDPAPHPSRELVHYDIDGAGLKPGTTFRVIAGESALVFTGEVADDGTIDVVTTRQVTCPPSSFTVPFRVEAVGWFDEVVSNIDRDANNTHRCEEA